MPEEQQQNQVPEEKAATPNATLRDHRHTGTDSLPVNYQDLLGIGFSQGDILYVGSNGRLTRLAAGTSGQFLETLGTGANPAWASMAPNQIVQNFPKADSNIVAGNVVSLVESGTTNFIIFDLNTGFLDVGKQANPDAHAVSFYNPVSLTGFSCSVYLKEQGASSDDVDIKLQSDNGGKPGTVVETQTIDDTTISGAEAEFTVTFTSAITAGTRYWISVNKQGSNSLVNYYQTRAAINGGWATTQFNGNKYNGGASDASAGTWTANDSPVNFRLSKSITAGLYRTIDLPNGLGLQGNVKGIAKTVNSSDVDVVISGIYTGSGYTSGVDYFLSPGTAGGLDTVGSTLFGRANSTTSLEIYPFKAAITYYAVSLTFTGSPAMTVMTGLRARKAHFTGKDGDASMGFFDGVTLTGKSLVSNATVSNNFWDDDTSGVGSSGSKGTLSSQDASTVIINFTSTANSPSFVGNWVFEK